MFIVIFLCVFFPCTLQFKGSVIDDRSRARKFSLICMSTSSAPAHHLYSDLYRYSRSLSIWFIYLLTWRHWFIIKLLNQQLFPTCIPNLVPVFIFTISANAYLYAVPYGIQFNLPANIYYIVIYFIANNNSTLKRWKHHFSCISLTCCGNTVLKVIYSC